MVGLSRTAGEGDWNGFRLLAIDGTSFSLLDTIENQSSYPQPRSQKAGCGFPVMGVGAVVDLSGGVVIGTEATRLTEHDASVARRLLDHLGEGDLLLADRAYCNYHLISNAQSGARTS